MENMNKHLRMMVFTLVLLLFAGVVCPPLPVVASPAGQTIPSRTPTPPPQPTSPPGSTSPPPQPTDPPGGTSPPAPTSPPGTTATNTPEVQLVETPAGGFLATAAPCTDPPTVQAQGTLNVRSGPGIDYEVIGQLRYLETRPITGRAGNAIWWQIEMANGQLGWVADLAVLVHGYTGRVPVLEPPALPGGITPTAGTPWMPTPDPGCEPLPTYTPTATETPPSGGTTTTPPPAGSDVATTAASPTPEVTPTATRDLSTATPRPVETSAAQATAAPLPTEEESAGSLNWLPLAGLGLLAAGVAVYFVRRR